MNQQVQEYVERRAALAAEIARQRRELVEAYHDLHKPIQYAEVGLKGVTFLRRNQWLFTAGPTVLSMVFSIIGLRKGKAKPIKGEIPNPAERSRSLIARIGGGALQAYQLYRRIKPYIS